MIRNLLPLSLILLTGCGTTEVADPGDRSSLYTQAGQGGPTVIFEAGGGDPRLTWSPVFLPIATDTTVFAYDRPGMHRGVRGIFAYQPDSYVPEADGLRIGEEVAIFLRNLLKEAEVAPPYVLVGHSLGGQYVLMYAKLYPNDVAGIVLVDSRPGTFEAACEAAGVGDIGQCAPAREEIATWPAAARDQTFGMFDTEPRLPTARQLGDIPITLIAATEPPDSSFSQELQAVWLSEQRRFAENTTNVRFVEATGATHYVHEDQPELVIREIRAMLENVRGASEAR